MNKNRHILGEISQNHLRFSTLLLQILVKSLLQNEKKHFLKSHFINFQFNEFMNSLKNFFSSE